MVTNGFMREGHLTNYRHLNIKIKDKDKDVQEERMVEQRHSDERASVFEFRLSPVGPVVLGV